jgi:hypothetical protein
MTEIERTRRIKALNAICVRALNDKDRFFYLQAQAAIRKLVEKVE